MNDNSQLISDLFYLLSATGLEDLPTILVYLVPMLLSWGVYKRFKSKREIASTQQLKTSQQAGLYEPVSLHPVIDRNICLGCATCVDACPEGNVLGVINEKAQIVNPSHCIGHGACKSACPTDAITLVLGTETRGVDIPNIQPNFETNVPGIFVAGELGGMGLIRNAIEQGRQAMENIATAAHSSDSNAPYDVVIVGAGPAGFSAALYAHEHNLKYIAVEQETLGGSVAHYPRGKIVMTSPMTLPILGLVKLGETTKELLVNFWREAEHKTGVRINTLERMDAIDKVSGGYNVTTSKGKYHTKTVLMAVGRRGSPRKLGVPGEGLNKVVYRLDDPEQYINHRVLVVGGGNSALETALSVSEQPGAEVTLSYRGNAFQKANGKLITRIDEAKELNSIQVLMNSTVKKIENNSVSVVQNDREIDIPNDIVIICAGGILPTALLTELGIEIETKYGTA